MSGALNGLFSSTQRTNNQTQGTQQGSTQSNLFNDPRLQGQLGNFFTQFSGPNINSVQAPVNAFQTEAAGNQSSLFPGLTTAFGTANNVAQTGIDPNRIQAYMSPYIQSVVNPTLDAQRIQNQQAVQGIQGNQAAREALGNNTGSIAAYYAGVQPGQQAQIAGLYNQGFNTAAGLTTQDVMSRLQGAGQVGSLSGVASGVNAGQFGMGEGIRQAQLQQQMTPFQLSSMGAGLANQWGNLAGVQTQGSTTGSSQGTTTATPSPISSMLGLAGLGSGLYDWWNSPGGKAMGGAVKGYASGGLAGGGDFADKVKHAVATFREMHKGGSVERKGFAAGGSPFWPAEGSVMTSAPLFGGFNSNTQGPLTGAYVGNPLAQFDADPYYLMPSAPPVDMTTGVNAHLATLANPAPSPVGGPPPLAPSPAGPPPAAGSVGVPQPHPATARSPWSSMTGLLLSGSPLKDMATHIIQDQEARLRAGQLLGNLYGQPTLEGQRQPSQIALQEAQTEQARVAADREFQSRLRREEAEHQKQLALQQTENYLNMARRLKGEREPAAQGNQAPAPNTAFDWRHPPLLSPTATPSPDVPAAPAPPPTPPIPFDNRNPRTGVVLGRFSHPYPYDQRSRANTSEHYIGQDGRSVYRRSGSGRTGDVYVGQVQQ